MLPVLLESILGKNKPGRIHRMGCQEILYSGQEEQHGALLQSQQRQDRCRDKWLLDPEGWPAWPQSSGTVRDFVSNKKCQEPEGLHQSSPSVRAGHMGTHAHKHRITAKQGGKCLQSQHKPSGVKAEGPRYNSKVEDSLDSTMCQKKNL